MKFMPWTKFSVSFHSAVSPPDSWNLAATYCAVARLAPCPSTNTFAAGSWAPPASQEHLDPDNYVLVLEARTDDGARWSGELYARSAEELFFDTKYFDVGRLAPVDP